MAVYRGFFVSFKVLGLFSYFCGIAFVDEAYGKTKFGMKRIGVAIGNTQIRHARPLTVLHATDGIPDWETIHRLIDQWQVTHLIVGLPYQIDGTDQEITKAARKFSRRLHAKFSLPISLVDERYSTKIAKKTENFKTNKKASIDSHAAAIILEAWLNDDKN
jgi:putative Holliday junction resolvase